MGKNQGESGVSGQKGGDIGSSPRCSVIEDVASLPRQTQKGPSDNWARRVEDHPEDED